ncbi:O-acetylhomoserine aminocarboxypropyltransferase/cysteine synthase family protein [Desulfurivibrio dismutans]|uniref:O-acetylhomoserine aminocarboxypropyltransferase/cysteine synthase family protein n=1 Tax=Desulfurivibrio dismutans TaxID=1398908 RepID=UPI0023DBD2D9|nr:PLP-dependent transferase [Desulfurivibrio alkaliphilus]MDF1615087.1 PLP-dependent transferase [Desulfurivibrio alkaliphilus]
MSGFATKAVHGNIGSTTGQAHHALRGPVYDTVSFGFASAAEIADAFAGRKPAHSYTRISNPTVAELEGRVQALAGGRGVVALSSGMAAISTTIMALAGAGTNIVAARSLFGNTASLLAHTLAPWGLETRFVDMDDLDQVASAIDADTRAVFCESITNPQLEVVDLGALAAISREKGVPLVVDNTATTFYLCRAGELGADIEVISSTKYLSGGGTAVGGLIIDHGSFDWQKSPRMAEFAKGFGPFALLVALRREISRNIGACLAPHNAWLQTLGLETLALRLEKSCQNALVLARFLKQLPGVGAVNYPGLPDSPYHDLATRQFGGRYGGILTFELAGRDECFACLDRLRLVRRATNINDNKTLAIHPASTIFTEFPADQRAAMGVGEGMIRISTGIEEYEDLQRDLEQAIGSA